MAMDVALVAAYRKAKMSTVPKDAMGAAMDKLQADLFASAEKLRAAKYKKVWDPDANDGEGGWVTTGELLEKTPQPEQPASYKDWKALQPGKYPESYEDFLKMYPETEMGQAGEEVPSKEAFEAAKKMPKDASRKAYRKYKKDFSPETQETKPQESVWLESTTVDNDPWASQAYRDEQFLEWKKIDLNKNKTREEFDTFVKGQHGPATRYKSAFHYGSPFHQNEEDQLATAALIKKEQENAKKEVYASPEWKKKKKKEVEKLASGAVGLTPAMYEQQQIVITKTKEDAFGENKYKLIENASENPVALQDLVESGVLGDGIEAEALINEYIDQSKKGLTVETMQKNKQGAANAKVANLAAQNESLKGTLQMLGDTVFGTAGRLSEYVNYDPENEFYNKTSDFLNPESPALLQEGGNFTVFSPTTGQQLVGGSMDGLINDSIVDFSAQTKVQKSIDRFGVMGLKDSESPKPKNSLPSDGDLMGSIDSIVRNTENFVSLMHDDLLGNNSSFAKDIEQLPEFMALAEQMDPTTLTALTLEDIAHVKDAIINPKNPFFDKERSIELVKKYIVERQKQAYNKNNTKFINTDPLYYINKYKKLSNQKNFENSITNTNRI